MVRRSPSEFYIKYLIAHPDKYDNDYIISVCGQLGLDYLGTWYIATLRIRHAPPVPFEPSNPGHTPSQEYLTKEMVRLAFFPDNRMKKAQSLINKPRIREAVETMILSGAPREAIAKILWDRYGFKITEQELAIYCHYFWNVDLLDTNDMRVLLRMRMDDVLDSKDPQVRGQHDAIKKGYYSDPRVTASRLPTSPVSNIIAQLQLGVAPRNLNVATLLSNVRAISTARALEAAVVGNATSGRDFMIMADTAHKMLEGVVRPEEQLRQDLERISLETSAAQVPLISSLSKGKHTTNLLPIQRAEEVMEEGSEELEDLEENDGLDNE